MWVRWREFNVKMVPFSSFQRESKQTSRLCPGRRGWCLIVAASRLHNTVANFPLEISLVEHAFFAGSNVIEAEAINQTIHSWEHKR